MGDGAESDFLPIRRYRKCSDRRVRELVSTMEPVVSSMEPVASSMEPVASSMEPVASSMKRVESSMQPVGSSMEPVASSMEPVAFSMEPVAFSMEPVGFSLESGVGFSMESEASLKLLKQARLLSLKQARLMRLKEAHLMRLKEARLKRQMAQSMRLKVSSTEPVASSMEPVVSSIEPVASSMEPVASSMELEVVELAARLMESKAHSMELEVMESEALEVMESEALEVMESKARLMESEAPLMEFKESMSKAHLMRVKDQFNARTSGHNFSEIAESSMTTTESSRYDLSLEEEMEEPRVLSGLSKEPSPLLISYHDSLQKMPTYLEKMPEKATIYTTMQSSTTPLMVTTQDMFEVEENQNLMKAMEEEIKKIGFISTSLCNNTQSSVLERRTNILCCFNEKDISFEFYFEDYESIVNIVSVGLEYAKVSLKEGWQVKVIELTKEDWENAWKNFESASNTLMVTLYDQQGYLPNMEDTKKQTSFSQKGRLLLWDIAKYFILEATMSSISSKNVSIGCKNIDVGITTRSPGSNQEASTSGGNISGNGNNISERLVQVVRTIFFGGSSNYWLTKIGENDPNADPSNTLDIQNVTTVHLELLPGGCFQQDEISIDNETQGLISQLDNTIHSEIKFAFILEPDNKEIQVTIGPISFQFGKENEQNYVKTGRFGWFHNFLDVSFHPSNPSDSKLCTTFKALDVEKGIETLTIAATEANMKGTEKLMNLGGEVSASILTLKLGTDLTFSEANTKTKNVEKTIMRYCDYTQGGFCITEKSNLASSNLRYTCLSPNYMLDLDHAKLSDEAYRNRVDSFPICNPQNMKFQGTWRPDNVESESQTMVEYILEASRVVHMTNKRSNGKGKKRPRRFFKSEKSAEIEEPNLPFRFEQKKVKHIYLNHAMTHLSGKVYKVRERMTQRPLNQMDPETYISEHQSLNAPRDWNDNPLVDVNR